jgi:hypothetical protein
MAEFDVLVADGLTTPFWILDGLYLWRKQPLGYVGGTALPGQHVVRRPARFFHLATFVAGAPFLLVDLVVILVMGLVVFIPFGLFVRGMIQAKQALVLG